MPNIFDFLNVPMGYIIRFCYAIVPNYLIALLFLAFLVKLLLFPLSIKQQKNMVKQASLKPREMAIRKRYAGRTDKVTQQKVQEEVMQLYQSEHFNPMGGCLPLLVQLPIIMSLYTVISDPLKYLCSFTVDQITAISARVTELYTASQLTVANLSQSIVDKLADAKALTNIDLVGVLRDNFDAFSDLVPEGFELTQLPDFHVLGGLLNLADVPSFNPITWLTIIPILTFVISFFSMKLTRKMTYTPTSDQSTAASMKIMDITMPLFSVWITFTVPAIIGVYWIYQNILSTLQQYILKKMFPIPTFTEEELKAAEREMNGTIRKEKKKVRSLHRIDEEDDNDEEADSEKKPALNESKAAALIGKTPVKDYGGQADEKKDANKKSDGDTDNGSDADPE